MSVLTVVILLAGCYYDKADQLYPDPSNNPGTGGNLCDTTAMSFTNDIKPIMMQYCGLAGCHDAATPSFGYDLTIYAGVKMANDADRLIGVINHQSGFQPMPKGMPKLNECNINKITAWVNQGALDN